MLKSVVDLKQILKNINEIKTKSNKDIIVVAKSDCYNLGAIDITHYLFENGVDFFAVVETKEAIQLINSNLKASILILNSVYLDELSFIDDNNNIIVTCNSLDDAVMLKNYPFKNTINVHLQIETGMNRIGIKTILEAQEIIKCLNENPKLHLQGIYTHYTSLNNLEKQEAKFRVFIKLYDFEMIHAAATSTYAMATIGNYVRVGLDCYGDRSDNQALSLVTKAIKINQINKFDTVGYDETYVASKEETIAVLPVGYNDGYNRHFTNAYVWYNGKKAKVVGRVCMNHIFVVVDDDVDLNTLFYLTSKENPANDLAKHLQTISYEVFCMMKINEREYLK